MSRDLFRLTCDKQKKEGEIGKGLTLFNMGKIK